MEPETRTDAASPSDPSPRPVRLTVGIFCFSLCALLLVGFAVSQQSFGWAFVFGVPFCCGLGLGQVSDLQRSGTALVASFMLLGLLAGAVTLELAGMLCGVIAATIFLVPTLLGVLVGSMLRERIRRSVSPRSGYASSALVLLACGAAIYAEGSVEPPAIEEVITTTRVMDMSHDRAWDVLRFYEDVAIDPPAFAKIGLPHPLHTEGGFDGVGDVVRCVYSSGHLVKRITQYEPGRRLGFDVIEQHGVEDRSVELLRGSFAFEPLPDGTTRVTLETVYRPLLVARPVWRPFEQSLAHVLHDHVLDGMAYEASRGVALAKSHAR